MTSLGDAYRSLPRSPEASSVRNRHLDFYRSFARRADDARFGRERDLWADLLEAELDNMRAALAWAIESGQAEAAQDLAASCIRLWECDRYTEGRIWLARSLAMGGGATSERVRALLAAFHLGRAGQRGEYLEEALTLAEEVGDPVLQADALRKKAWRLQEQGREAEAAAAFERAVELGRGVPAAAAYFADALRGLAPFRAKGDTPDLDPDAFLQAFRSRLEEARDVLDAPGFEGAACVHLGLHAKALADLGDLNTPVELYTKKLALEEDPGLAATRPDTLLSLGDLHLKLERRDEARELWQQVIDMGVVDEGNVLRAELALARLDLGEANLESARQRVERAVAIARRAQDPVDQYPTAWPDALVLSAGLAERAGDLVGAERALLEAVTTAPPGRRSAAVSRLASLADRSGDRARAIRLLRDEVAELDDPDGLAALLLRAKLAEMQGDDDTAWKLVNQARDKGAYGVRTPTSIFSPLQVSLALTRGDLAEARRLVDEAMSNSPQPAVRLLCVRAQVALAEGDSAAAWSTLQQLLPQWPDMGDESLYLVDALARAAIGVGRVERGAQFLGLAETERERLMLGRNEDPALKAAEETARAAIGDEAFERERARGRRMDLHTELLAEARSAGGESDDE